MALSLLQRTQVMHPWTALVLPPYRIKVITAATITAQERLDLLKLIRIVGKTFVPPIEERISNEGYLDYLLGINQPYVRSKYGDLTPAPKGAHLVCMYDLSGRLMGFTAYYVNFQPFDGAYFICVMVHPDHQGKNLGKTLIAETLRWVKLHRVKSMCVTTWSTNIGSLKAFQSNGFSIYKTVKNERRTGIDGIYMCRYW